MTRDHSEATKRPRRVVILDADDPMTEVQGEFVWLDEHERLIQEARRQAFADGYDAAQREIGSAQQNVHLELVRRGSLTGSLLHIAIAVAVLCLVLALPVIVFGG